MSAPWRIGGVLLLAGCSGANAGKSDPQPCAPVEAAAATVTADGLAGEYHLRLVATSGAKRGTTAAGPLTLMPHDSADQRLESAGGSSDTTFTLPLYGTTEVDFASVGAVAPGDPTSSDPGSPGVLVMEGSGRVMLRMGSEANRRGMRRFDGGFTALRVQQVTDKGFAGTWQSGVGLELSGGHFCADRAT
ncbi:MAG: hypothetical protein ACREM9_09250 [Gemmatimonadales bacterium]